MFTVCPQCLARGLAFSGRVAFREQMEKTGSGLHHLQAALWGRGEGRRYRSWWQEGLWAPQGSSQTPLGRDRELEGTELWAVWH